MFSLLRSPWRGAIITTTLNNMGMSIMAKLEKILAYSSSISWGEINDEIFIFDELNGNIYLFKNLERKIWKLIEERMTILSLIDLMQKKFDVDVEKTLKVIVKFQEKNLVEEVKL